jgi:peptidoglycan biosynthesis protein MviN/MurJ (putative lipid II flippase)
LHFKAFEVGLVFIVRAIILLGFFYASKENKDAMKIRKMARIA